MEKKYLLFGGSGFIGGHLADKIKTIDGVESIVLDTELPKSNDLDYEKIDVRTTIKTKYKPSAKDVIFNLAAVHRTPGHPSEEYFETNILGAKNVCEYAVNNNINTIVFTSSIAIYGIYEEQKSEETLPMPNIPYGISKLSAEYIHIAWYKEDPKNRTLVILRPGVVFGANERGNFTRLVNSIAKKKFVYPGRKDTIKGCIYVKDLVNSMLQMADSENNRCETYNMTYEPAPTIEKICEVISNKGKLTKPSVKIPSNLILLLSTMLFTFFRKKELHPDRIKKLFISNDINGEKLKNKYTLSFGLENGMEDWMKETDFYSKNKIY